MSPTRASTQYGKRKLSVDRSTECGELISQWELLNS